MKNKVNNQQFAVTPKINRPRSTFPRTFGHTTTMNSDFLVPIFWDEILPGDTVQMKASVFGRIQSMIAPIMDNYTTHLDWFFVPERIVWENFTKMMGERFPNPDSSVDYLFPQITAPATVGWETGTLGDYFGLPIDNTSPVVRASLFRMYNLIFREWYRSQQLQDSPTVDMGDGPDDPANYVLLKRNKKMDYFTGCIPAPQLGDAVVMPLGDTAPVVSTGETPVFAPQSGNPFGDGSLWATVSGGRMFRWKTEGTPTNGVEVKFADDANEQTGLEADLSSATGGTINQWRQALQLQAFLEIDARSGTRYVESNYAHYGVTSPDQRLQRPELIRTFRSDLAVQEVPQTSESNTTPQANLSAYGYVGLNCAWSNSFTEHGMLIGLLSITGDVRYQQGLHKMWSRRSRTDIYHPVFSGIGEQPVYSKEIYYDGTSGDDDVFGYLPYGSEYRYKASMITGKLRSQATNSLDVWHCAEEFGSRPVLGDTFIQYNTPTDRIINVTNEPHFIVDTYFQWKHTRVMPIHEVPASLTRI